jgi:hypothetical protein
MTGMIPTAKSQVNSTYYDFGLTYFFNVWTKVQVYYSLRNQEGPASTTICSKHSCSWRFNLRLKVVPRL